MSGTRQENLSQRTCWLDAGGFSPEHLPCLRKEGNSGVQGQSEY